MQSLEQKRKASVEMLQNFGMQHQQKLLTQKQFTLQKGNKNPLQITTYLGTNEISKQHKVKLLRKY